MSEDEAMPSEFDPEKVERMDIDRNRGLYVDGAGELVWSHDYDSLLALHRADRERIKGLEVQRDYANEQNRRQYELLEIRERRIASLEAALRVLMPSEYISTEKIGWRGTSPPTNDHFQCEFCNASDLDCILIPHKIDCIILRLRALLAPNVEEEK